MAIRCNVHNCKFNRAGWCDNDYIEIRDKVCQEYEEVDSNGCQRV